MLGPLADRMHRPAERRPLAGPFLALGVLLCAAAAARAAEVPRRLQLGEAERLLVERNLPVIAARQGVDIARAQRLVAATSPVPTASAGLNLFHVDDNNPSTGSPRIRSDNPFRNANVGLSYVYERGGKLELRTRVADDQIGVAEAQVLDALRLQLGQLRQAYLNAVLAHANLLVAFQNRESLDNTERLLRSRVRLGESPAGDLVRFQASRLQFETDLTTARIAYESAARDVLNLLGATAREVSGPQSGAPELAGTALAVEGALTVEPKPLDPAVLRQALDSRADVVAARRSLDAADSSLALARAARYRDITLNPTIGRFKADPSAGTQFTFGVSVPIFNERVVEGNVMIATGQRSQVATQSQAARLTAETEFDKAWRSTELSEELVRVYSGEALARAEEAFRITRAAFERGAQSLLDVLDAQRTLSQTRVAVNQARFTYLSNLFLLEQASGIDGLVELR